MNPRLASLSLALMCGVGLVISCQFSPDLDRFDPCGENDTCPAGFWCLAEVRRCVPECGPDRTCTIEPPPEPDAGDDGGVDAGTDGGVDPDAGTDAGTDAGPDASVPLSLVTETLALGVEDAGYFQELQAQGGMPPYQFQTQQPLPEGLTLDGGVISGKPTTPGTYRVTVKVSDTDSPPAQASSSYDLRVRARLVLAGPVSLVEGYNNNAYSEMVSATGGVPPYTFQIVGGTFPGTLTFRSDGGVSGTPSENQGYSFRVRVQDSDPEQPQMVEQPLSLNVTGLPLFLKIANETIPSGRAWTPYQYVLRATASANWNLTGSLPGGIVFYPNGEKATLEGIPTAPGDYTFTVTVSGGLLSGSDTNTFTFHVD